MFSTESVNARTLGDHVPRPCARCGIERQVRHGRPNICRDCKDVLTRAEWEAWVA